MSFPARYPGVCAKCSAPIAAGIPVNYDPDTRKIRHAPRCPDVFAHNPKPETTAVPTATVAPSETLKDDSVIRGKATYKGKPYLLLWEGDTRRGPAAKLAFRDGSKTFWASAGEYEVIKRYHDREWRGRTEPGMTLGKLNRLAEEYKQAKKDGIEPCGKCGGIHRPEDRTCSFCGCTRCDGARGGLCEDD